MVLNITENNHNIDIVVKMTKNKIVFYRDVLQKTYIHIVKNHTLEIVGSMDIKRCVNLMEKISEKIDYLYVETEKGVIAVDNIVSDLQNINNDMSNLLKTYGTSSLEDLLCICFGSSNLYLDKEEEYKYEVLKKYFHPTSYKTNCKTTSSSTGDDKNQDNLECVDILNECKVFHMKIHGMKLYFHHRGLNKHIYVYGIVDDILIDFLNETYVNTLKFKITKNIPSDNSLFYGGLFDRFVKSRILKDYLIYNFEGFYKLFIGYNSDTKLMLSKTLSCITKDFLSQNIFFKRKSLIQLLASSDNPESKYMCYLLYDLLSNDTENKIDTEEQMLLLNSFSHNIRSYFNEAMKETIQYTNELSTYDTNKIPLEQQICLMKSDDIVKEKAMVKLKEVKAKSEDSGSKARQFLEGLLKIPFGVLKKEPIMELMKTNSDDLQDVINHMTNSKVSSAFEQKERYTSLEIVKTSNEIKKLILTNTHDADDYENISVHMFSGKKPDIINNIKHLNEFMKKYNNNSSELIDVQNQSKSIKYYKTSFNKNMEIYKSDIELLKKYNATFEQNKYLSYYLKIETIFERMNKISKYMSNVKDILDQSVHGHVKAKIQIERIIGQWINGKQTGYCFGFEGPPGTGKTSLAKYGLSKCLIDDNGASRPFSMIAIGGDANGSTLHGHNYTYVGSSWGSIVQILMDNKCMNPIIFIDELDKISKTENGREIIGILTHLLDPTQNDSFQDKYFNGINLDLSNVLFVLSYNDAELIDRILLDRIHRIQFSNLSLSEKIVIVRKHLLPDIYDKMGLTDMILFEDDVIQFIIENYTLEPGVRKLKEKLFDIIGEINLNILKSDISAYDYPISVTIEDIKTKYFKDKQEIRIKKINGNDRIGHANGMWANAVGQGGTLPIEASFYPCDKYLHLKLTGMQGDVMQESMNVALTIAYNMTNEKRRKEIMKKYDSEHKWGIHLHTPAASDPKNGPSAGSCITTTIYSLLNNKKIKHDFALTGEIMLDGSITEIGGLDLKILGSIKSGVKNFIYPQENEKDAEELRNKYKNEDILKDIQFYPVSRIEEVFEIIFE